MLVAAVALAGLLLGNRVPPVDRWLLSSVYTPLGDPISAIATAVSGVGTLIAVVAFLVSLGFVWRRTHSVGVVLRHLAVLAAGMSVILAQLVFQRSGPPVTDQDWTYPSGHAVFLTAIAFTVVVAAPMRWRRVVAMGAATAVALVAASRLVLGEHYLVDVVAAVLATVGVGVLAATAMRLPVRPRI
jgi:membrane-associated phospholipid phosphatase